jgi:viroplasmin and RNaseH domain-containing protein
MDSTTLLLCCISGSQPGERGPQESYNDEITPPTTMNYLRRNVNGAKVEKLYTIPVSKYRKKQELELSLMCKNPCYIGLSSNI